MKRFSIVLLLCPLLFLNAQEEKSYSAKEVVVTASRTEESIGLVTQKIDVLADSLFLRFVYANRNLTEAVQYTPGIHINVLSRNDANWGTYGGIGPKYSIYLLSGIQIDAFVDPMALDLLPVEKIEIQRGPASVLYGNYMSQDFAGNQSSLAGTVNFILKEKVQKQKTVLSSSAGSYRTLNGQLYYENVRDNVNYFAGATYEQSDYTDYGAPNSWLAMTKNPQYIKKKLFGGATVFFNDDEQQKLKLFVSTTAHRGDAGRIHRGYDHNYNLFNGGYATTLTSDILLNLNFGLRTYDRSWQESTTAYPDALLSTNGVYQRILPTDIVVSIKHGDDNLLILGADYQDVLYYTWSDPLQGYKSFKNVSRSKQAALFAQEEYRVQKLILRGGARVSYIENRIDLIDGNAPGKRFQDWTTFLWSFGLKYNMAENISIYSNAGNSFLVPGLKAVGGTISLSDRGIVGRNGQLPNPDLKPEFGIGLDAGVTMYLQQEIKLGARVFFNRINDAIIENVVSLVPSQTQSINGGKALSRGIEIEYEQSLSNTMNIFGNYTYVNTKMENPINTDQDGTEIPFAPDHIINVGFDYNLWGDFVLSPRAQYAGWYYDSNSKSGRNSFKQGWVVNLVAQKKIATKNNLTTDAFVQLYNVTDNRYLMPWGFRNTGVAIQAGLKATFF